MQAWQAVSADRVEVEVELLRAQSDARAGGPAGGAGAESHFTEEMRSRQPSVFSIVREVQSRHPFTFCFSSRQPSVLIILDKPSSALRRRQPWQAAISSAERQHSV